MKKICILLCAALSFSCQTDKQSGQEYYSPFVTGFRIGDAFDSENDDFLESRVSNIKVDGVDTVSTEYNSRYCRLTVEEGRIAKIYFNKNNHPVPPEWEETGLSWGVDFYSAIDLFTKLGYGYRIDYPPYRLPFNGTNGNIYAYDPENLNIKYYLHFYGNEVDEEGRISPRLMSLLISKGSHNGNYPQKLKYAQRTEMSLDTPAKREAVGLSGLLGQQNLSDHNRLDPFPGDADKGRNVLGNSWGIHSKEELLDTLDSLKIEGGHTRSFGEAVAFLDNAPEDDLLNNAVDSGLSDTMICRVLLVNAVIDIPGLRERRLRAWDWGRGINLCRWGYNAGYLTEAEAWDSIMEYRELILSFYNSWEDYTVNYAIGRMFWYVGMADRTEYLNKANEVFKAYTTLIHTKDSIWQDSWDIDDSVDSRFPYENKLSHLSIDAPDDLSAWKYYVMGLKFYQIKEYDEAKSKFRISHNKNKRFFHAIRYLNFCERLQGNREKALEYSRSLLDITPDDYFALLVMGETLEESGSLDEAEQYLRDSIDAKAEYSGSYGSLIRVFLKQGKYEEAEELFADYDKKVDEKNDYIHLLRAIVYHDQEKFEKAVDYLLRCYESYRANSQVNMLMGKSYLFLEAPEYDLAYLYLKKAEEGGYPLAENLQEFIRDYETNKGMRSTDGRT